MKCSDCQVKVITKKRELKGRLPKSVLYFNIIIDELNTCPELFDLPNIKGKKNYQNILFQSKDTAVTMSKFASKNRIYANFIGFYLRTESRYQRTFFSFEFVSRSSFSNRHQIYNNINLEI